MRAWIWFLLAIFMLCPAPVSAEFYKYTDKDGYVRYTDNLNDVPEKQRADAQQYIESKNGTAALQGDGQKEGTPQTSEDDDEMEQQQDGDQLMERKRLLDERKADLEQERDALAQEKASIDKEQEALVSSKKYKMERGKQSAQTRNKIKEINERVQVLNEKLKSLEKIKTAYEADAAAFNEELNKALGK